ncbi:MULTISPECIES: thiamine pyrophosphate-binding protein [unclassified Roseateles]|uniref:thiamine pyrophosphate-binding protein n=1 Tax=unclassified Roseateles TaxID=2626991 RepID=UPI0006F4EABA|nr:MULTISPECIES: thiamine pyrophosphate-binding protein [unclassified Roseateles]KQW44607.1 thiamine pyrophosphate-binding protein [Pelomonas sp. Root405]KRA69966.1 thiamine pyrophosphate-binding protein [Pelomonas sp. Root662]
MTRQATTPSLAGHKLVEALIAQGIDTAFGVPGESFLAVLDGFHEYADKIRFIACRQEGGAAFMAEAQGKLTGKPGICFVTRGPGATNASIGLHTAFQDSTPMILFIGQVASDQRDREAFQEVDYRQMFGPGTLGMAKWVGEVHDAERLPEYVARAFHTAMQGRPGPVVLVLPEDMLTKPITAPVVAPARPAEAAPTPAALAELRERLAAAKKPLVIAGGGGWTSEATTALQAFAEAWQLPVGCAFRFQDLFDNAHPNYAGDVGIGINPKLAARVKEADLILAIGPRLGEMTTGGYTLLQAPRPAQQLIHIHAGAEELGRVYTAELLINASMGQAAPALAALQPPADIAWRDWTAAAHADYEANLVPTPVAPLDMAEVIRLVDAKLPEGSIFTNGAGNYSGWLHRFHRYTALHRFGKTQLAPTSGAMGYGVPAAVAAALLQDRWVVNIAGDGDFLMTGQELATAIGYGARKLLVIVVDNGTYGTIRMHQEREYPGRVAGSDLFNPDFARLAEAFGFAAFKAESTAEVGPALDAAIASAKPALLHLRLSSDVSTSRSTLTAIRESAQRRLQVEG